MGRMPAVPPDDFAESALRESSVEEELQRLHQVHDRLGLALALASHGQSIALRDEDVVLAVDAPAKVARHVGNAAAWLPPVPAIYAQVER